MLVATTLAEGLHGSYPTPLQKNPKTTNIWTSKGKNVPAKSKSVTFSCKNSREFKKKNKNSESCCSYTAKLNSKQSYFPHRLKLYV